MTGLPPMLKGKNSLLSHVREVKRQGRASDLIDLSAKWPSFLCAINVLGIAERCTDDVQDHRRSIFMTRKLLELMIRATTYIECKQNGIAN
jgi:hypothetical protein